MSTEQHIDLEVTDAAVDAWFAERGIDGGITGPVEREAMKAALDAAEEKRRELAQSDPEGQEYAYRVSYTNRTNGHVWHLGARDLDDAANHRKELAREGYAAWVERALLGDWERVG